MKKLFITLLALTCLGPLANGQSVDLGRGELPLTVPQSYDGDTPLPLIVLLHGYTSSGQRQDRYMGFSELADDYGFLMVAPDGTREAEGDRNPFWNASNACCNFYQSEVDDSGYIMAIIDTIKSEYNVDPDRVYLVGHSNGGFMSYRLAWEHSDSIAAIASLAGASHQERREPPANPVHILQIHGTADATIAYRGGDIQDIRYPGALASVQRWAEYNGCAGRGKARELRDLDASLPGYETGVLKFEVGCRPGGSSELWTITAGAHSPLFSDTFAEQVVEWLFAHPKH